MDKRLNLTDKDKARARAKQYIRVAFEPHKELQYNEMCLCIFTTNIFCTRDGADDVI